jgi:hypothetical protein
MQLLAPMATTAFQTMGRSRRAADFARDSTGRPTKVDSCYAYGASNALVENNWPEYYRPAKI